MDIFTGNIDEILFFYLSYGLFKKIKESEFFWYKNLIQIQIGQKYQKGFGNMKKFEGL